MDPLCDSCAINPACYFVLLDAGKRKACLSHLPDLVSLKQPIFHMVIFDLIQSAEDAALYEVKERELNQTWDEEKVRKVALDYASNTGDSRREFQEALCSWKKSFDLLILQLPKDLRSLYSDAETSLRESWEISKKLNSFEVPMSSSEETIRMMTILADVLRYSEKLGDAEVLLQKAVVIAQVQKLWGCLNIASSRLALVYAEMGRMKEAEQLLSVCELGSPRMEERAHILMTHGDVLVYMNRYENAEERFKAALTIFEASFPNAIYPAGTLYNLGILYSKMQRNAEAEERFNSALTIFQANFPNAIYTAKILNGLGVFYYKMQRYAEAEERFNSALTIYQAFPNAIYTANTFNYLGVLYQTMQRHAEAEKLYKSALTIYHVNSSLKKIAQILMRLRILYITLHTDSEKIRKKS